METFKIRSLSVLNSFSLSYFFSNKFLYAFRELQLITTHPAVLECVWTWLSAALKHNQTYKSEITIFDSHTTLAFSTILFFFFSRKIISELPSEAIATWKI